MLILCKNTKEVVHMFKINAIRRIRSASAKQFVVAGVFALALTGAIGLGLATKQNAAAATARDCSANSVNLKNLNGGCGAGSAAELVADMKQNDPGDLQTTYSQFGLTPAKYEKFASTAKQGIAYMNGDVVVDGQKVMTDAWSIGRTKFGYSSDMKIGNTMFYKSMHTSVLNKNHDVMVMFDANGNVEAAVLNACGNPVDGKKVPSAGECKALNMTPVQGKENTYKFTTTTSVSGNASIAKVVYTFSDGTKVEKTNPAEAVEKTFTKSGTAKVDVYVKLPGGQTKVVTAATCTKSVTVTPPKTPNCPVPGKEQYPVDSPECKENCPTPGKEHLPKDSPECEVAPTTPTPPAELPKTGMGNVLGLFAGASVAGGVAHRFIQSRRRS